MAKKKPENEIIYQITEQDKQILAHTQDSLDDFASWFFDMVPIPWQHWFYHQPQKRKFVIAGIRSGKTYFVSLGFPHFALFTPASRIANASISSDQAKIVFYNVLELVSRPNFERYVKNSQKSPHPMIELINGSQMWFRSVGYEAELWRGWEFDWINIDEAAYIGTKNAYDTLVGRLLGHNKVLNRPREGLLTITSSPKGRQGWLYEEYLKGVKGSASYQPDRYLSIHVSSLHNPYLNHAELKAIASDYSERQRQQELEGRFLDPEDAVFSITDIQRMSDTDRPEVKALIDEIDALAETPQMDGFVPKVFDKADYHRYELPPGQNKMYLVSWDLGTSATRHKGRNATVGFVFDITQRPWRIVAYRREVKATYPLILRWVKEWHLKYNNHGQNGIETVIDSSGSGNAIQQFLQDENRLDVEGVVYNDTNKPDIIHAGQICMERGWVIAPPIRALYDELCSYEMDDKKIVQDCVMAFCQGLHRARLRMGDYHRPQDIVLPTRTGREYTRSDRLHIASERYDARRRMARTVRKMR